MKINDIISTHSKLPYRRGVGLMIVNKDRKVFIGKRVDTWHDVWQMPQGGIEDNETIMEAAIRELAEETSIKNVYFISESKCWFFYDVPEFLLSKLWGGMYRGQKQKWLLFKFIGNEDEIDVSNVETAEFVEWKWVDVEQLPELVVNFKKQLYASIIKEFSPFVKSLEFQE